MAKNIRVLVADDSALMRKKISDIISSDKECEVVAVTRDGEETIKAVVMLQPDVVTLDIQMPKMDGLTCLGYIMSEWPTPVVMMSAFTEEGSEDTLKSLELGAIDFVQKPSGVISLDVARVRDELISKIKMAAEVDLSKLRVLVPGKADGLKSKFLAPLSKVVVIGCSTGGPRALTEILPELPADIAAGILVVQHMPSGFTNSMAKRLDWLSVLKVKEAEAGEPIEAGKILIAPGSFEMTVERNNGKEIINLAPAPKTKAASPSIDASMCSIASIYKNRTMGVILTGMGNDGTKGFEAIKRFNGCTIAEHESTAVIYGMPKSVVDAGLVDDLVPLGEIANRITALAGRKGPGVVDYAVGTSLKSWSKI